MVATLPAKKKKTTTKKKPASKAGLPAKTAAQKERAARIYAALLRQYPDAHCELDYKTPLELLVAVILSAQSTDVGVNKATPKLFARFKNAADYASVTPVEIEEYIKTIGLFRNKAKSIHTAATRIVEHYEGKVPGTMEELLTLHGVARKTANVVLGEAFKKAEGVVVDTHVMRLSQRFALTKYDEPAKIERDLMALFPQENWPKLSHLLIWHGRYSCKARGGNCATDPVCIEFCANAKQLAKDAGATKKKSKTKKRSSTKTAK